MLTEVRKLARRTSSKPHNPSDNDATTWEGNSLGKIERQIKGLFLKLQQKHSSCSSKYKRDGSKVRPGRPPEEKFRNCNQTHEKNNCGAAGQKCYSCQGLGHYGRASECHCRRRIEDQGRRRTTPSWTTNRRVAGEKASVDSDATFDSVSGGKIDMGWPGV